MSFSTETAATSVELIAGTTSIGTSVALRSLRGGGAIAATDGTAIETNYGGAAARLTTIRVNHTAGGTVTGSGSVVRYTLYLNTVATAITVDHLVIATGQITANGFSVAIAPGDRWSVRCQVVPIGGAVNTGPTNVSVTVSTG